jgi:hypothetical protein
MILSNATWFQISNFLFQGLQKVAFLHDVNHDFQDFVASLVSRNGHGMPTFNVTDEASRALLVMPKKVMLILT